MNYKKPDIFPFGERAILIKWEEKIDEKLLDFILSTKNSVLKSEHKPIVEVTHTYNSLLINYEYIIKNIYDEILTLKTLVSSIKSNCGSQKMLHHLPVCYHENFGLDSHQIAEGNKLDFSQIKTLHSTPIYTLFFTGFLPGFPYLGGLDKKLFFPRKKSPRKFIKKGAVGIAGKQTGIYPKPSPGGWQIIGNCPLDFFDAKQNPPTIFNPGDKIKFYPIDLNEHRQISGQVQSGTFKIQSEKYED